MLVSESIYLRVAEGSTGLVLLICFSEQLEQIPNKSSGFGGVQALICSLQTQKRRHC